uniref:Uncharacterized protein n=1 Tax=Anopheles dirus TaxID=7168 RepID=A0A182NW05_9DIPT
IAGKCCFRLLKCTIYHSNRMLSELAADRMLKMKPRKERSLPRCSERNITVGSFSKQFQSSQFLGGAGT